MLRLNRLRDTILVILVPVLVLALVGLLTGSLALGGREVAVLALIWILGIAWVWWPHKGHQEPQKPA